MQIGSSGAGINKYGLDIWYDGDAREGLTGVLAEIVRFLPSLVLLSLINGPSISQSIINSMRQLAANALGISTGISPSSIVDMAFAILTKVSSAASIWSPMISTIMITVAIIVLVVMSL